VAKRHFLFDLDGTLVDSSPSHARAFREALAAEEPALVRAFDYEALKGRTTADAARLLGIEDPRRVARMVAAKQAAYRRLVEQGAVSAFPGAEWLLGWLCEHGRNCFLVTGASRASTDLLLGRLGLARYFAGRVTADDVANGKPDPEGLQLVLTNERLRPAQCLVIEDAASGVAAARAAGLDVVVVHGTLPTAEQVFADLFALGAYLGARP
jgi:HAD superfamily hydrolase (TIGR01509 family)